MKFVNMNEVAFDPTTIVFPGLGNCHGIVYVNEFGLFAFHNFGNPTTTSGTIGEFGSFVRNHVNGRTRGICLYGACPSNRHSTDKSHKTELKLVADAIGFNGKIYGCRWDIAKLNWGTTYTEFQYNRTAVTIEIENFTGGGFQNGANTAPLDHKAVRQVQSRTVVGQYEYTSCKTISEVVTGVVRPFKGTGQMVQAKKL